MAGCEFVDYPHGTKAGQERSWSGCLPFGYDLLALRGLGFHDEPYFPGLFTHGPPETYWRLGSQIKRASKKLATCWNEQVEGIVLTWEDPRFGMGQTWGETPLCNPRWVTSPPSFLMGNVTPTPKSCEHESISQCLAHRPQTLRNGTCAIFYPKSRREWMRSGDSPTGAAKISAAGKNDSNGEGLFTPLSGIFPAISLILFYRKRGPESSKQPSESPQPCSVWGDHPRNSYKKVEVHFSIALTVGAAALPGEQVGELLHCRISPPGGRGAAAAPLGENA